MRPAGWVRLPGRLRSSTPLGLFAVAAVAFGVILLRGGSIVTRPQFWAEDGTAWFADAYNHGPFTSLTYTYSGYFQTLSRVVGGIAAQFPLHCAPRGMSIVAVLIELYTAVFMCRSRFYERFGSRPAAVVLAAAYLCLPNSVENFANLTNSQWHLAFLTTLIVVSRPAQARWDRILDATIVSMFALTGPFVVILLPLAAFLYWRVAREHRLLLLIMTVGCCVQIIAIIGVGRVGHVGGVAYHDIPTIYAKQVILGGMFGQAAAANPVGGIWGAAGFLAWLAFTIYVLIAAPARIKLLYGYGLVAFVAAMLSLKSVGTVDTGKFFQLPGAGQRYYFLPMLSVLAGLLWAAFKSPHLAARGMAIAALAVVVAVGVRRDFRYQPVHRVDYTRYEEQLADAAPGEAVTIPVNPGLSMTLRRRAGSSPSTAGHPGVTSARRPRGG